MHSRTRSVRFCWVAAAILVDARRQVLLMQQPSHKEGAGKWGFPGGKMMQGESARAALQRELLEELGIVPYPDKTRFFAIADYRYAGFHLLMPVYHCRGWRGSVRACEGQCLRWQRIADVDPGSLLPSNRPLFAAYRAVA